AGLAADVKPARARAKLVLGDQQVAGAGGREELGQAFEDAEQQSGKGIMHGLDCTGAERRRGDRRTYPRERGSAGYQWAFAPKWCIGRWACTIRGLPTVAGTPAVRAGVSGPHAVNPHATRASAPDQGMQDRKSGV